MECQFLALFFPTPYYFILAHNLLKLVNLIEKPPSRKTDSPTTTAGPRRQTLPSTTRV